MKVKIGNTFFDSEAEPIMIILSPVEKNMIGNMGEQTKFVSFPLTPIKDISKIREFMKDETEMQKDYFK